MSSGAETARYGVPIRLRGRVRWILWKDAEHSRDHRVVLDPSGRILMADGFPELVGLALAHNLRQPENEGLRPLDLDRLTDWLRLRGKPARKRFRQARVECPLFLEAWNLFDDLFHALGDPNRLSHSPRADRIYSKLFHGCNLPGFTSTGEPYVPAWTEWEMALMRRVLRRGLSHFLRRLPADFPAGGP